MEVYYYTDPACPWSWALEPSWRKLLVALGEDVEVRYVMAGMAKEFGEAVELIAQTLEAGAESGMPVDPRIWLQGAPGSSFPACIAVKAAAEQGDPAPYLRRLREGFQCRRRKLDTGDALLEEARATGGLDLERFRIDLGSHAILEAFAADIERAKEAGGGERVTLPALEFEGRGRIEGFSSFEDLRRAAGVADTGGGRLGIEDALRRFGTLSTAEVAAVCELPGPRAPAELWRMASEWRVKPERLGSGELWTLA